MVLMVLRLEACSMAFFLKKSNLKKGTYLQIYESFYNHDKKETAHKSYKVLGYVDDLIASGIPDPIEYYTEVVHTMNAEVKLKKEKDKTRFISSSPERNLGYFLLKNLYDDLHVSNYLNLLQSQRDFRFQISDLIEALVYARVTEPCSKSKTLQDVLPTLYNEYDLSYDQILDGVEYIGMEYEKIIEIFNHQIHQKYPVDTSVTYFDCTNFYFEIDREDDFRKKGPSKENRRDPIVGLGLLLDAHQIPIGMRMYPGNESEKPVIREIIAGLKSRNNITGRTIQVADKGLNCANNIIAALKNKDGYLFSKSVKTLPAVEKTWVLLDNDWKTVPDQNGTLLYKIKECVDDFPYTYTDENGEKRAVRLREKRVVTYNPKLAEKKRYEINRLVEKARSLSASHAKTSEYGESGKYVTFRSTDAKGNITDDKVIASLNQAAIDEDLKLAGYNLLVTSEIKMKAEEIYGIYHNLWRIEESFRVMKSYLDGRPVYLQKTNSIIGHFLICYLSVVLIRLLQFNALKNKYCSEDLFGFIRGFRLVEIEHNKYINLAASSETISRLADDLSLPLTSFFLSDVQLKSILAHRL